ncbi:ORF6C domain-containing protein [Clostridiaceae bacterium Marseille-Q4143]|nr:ORF6C domain-containing protein [Clostridiaceae bacterium Marseille-Q4143]
MNNLQVFNSEEFGQVRTMVIDGEPWFVGKDVAEALGYERPTDTVRKRVDDEDRGISKMETPSGKQEMTIINESGLYTLVLGSKLDSAKRFKRWVTSEVLPTIRKTGSYNKPMTEAEQIRLLAKGATELYERVDKVETKIETLENDMPLYGCEIEEVSQHVRRKAVSVLGGKDSEAYNDGSIRSLVFSDIYTQLKREYGLVTSYKSIKRKYLADVHEFIDSYELPRALEEQINDANAQISTVWR